MLTFAALLIPTDFPVIVGPDTSYNGNITQYSDAFITKLNAAEMAWFIASYLGGTATDLACAVAVDASGRACLTGTTGNNDFPLAVGPDQSFNGVKMFL